MPLAFFEHMESERLAGLAEAHINQPNLERQVFTHDRFQASWAMRNMLRALEIHPWRNTGEDWRRYYETKIIMAARLRHKKGQRMYGPSITKWKDVKENPGHARRRSHARGEIILFQGKTALVKGTRTEIDNYMSRNEIYARDVWELAV